MKSIIQSKKECYFCKSQRNLQLHHCFQGANRKQADKQGLTVWLCMDCHTGSRGVHTTRTDRLNELKVIAQREFEKTHTRDDFVRIFHKNYIMEEE